MNCELCEDQKIVCENHPYKPWGEGNSCCEAGGMLCSCHSLYKKDKGIIE